MCENSTTEHEIESVASEEFDWAVVNSLLQAQTHTNASLERYLLYVTHDDFDIPTEHVDETLSQAITSQKRALDDLKAARQFVRESDKSPRHD